MAVREWNMEAVRQNRFLRFSSPPSRSQVLWISIAISFLTVTIVYNFMTPPRISNSISTRMAEFKDYTLIDAALDSTNESLTIVTGMFDIGSFQKGYGGRTRTIDEYRIWMKTWARLQNRVVFYTNNATLKREFEAIRASRPESSRRRTRTILMDLEKGTPFPMWSMGLLPNITRIFKTPNYPNHPPNTVVPMYSVVMNAKYDLLDHAIRTNAFGTEHFVWFDISIYRDYPEGDVVVDGNGASHTPPECARVGLPPGFNKSNVAVSRVGEFHAGRTAGEIISANEVWVCGGAVFGHWGTLKRYIDQFRMTAIRMIARGWISTDQQTVYSMFADRSLGVPVSVQVQPYDSSQWGVPTLNSNPWYYIAFLALGRDNCD